MSQHEHFNRLMLALSVGDQSVLDRLVDELYPIVLRFCSKMVDQPSDAQDATQRAFEKLIAGHTKYDAQRGNALSWVLAIASWECKTLRRRAQRHAQRHVEEKSISDLTQDQSALLIEKERLQKALRALETLNDKDRKALERSLIEKTLSPLERKQKQRALTRLRRAMGFS